MAASGGQQIDTVMQEKRVFAPSPQFVAGARIKSLEEYEEIWEHAAADPPKFWTELAREELHWFKPFIKTLEWNEPFAQWFVGGKTNASYNCLDRNLAAIGNRTAILWEGEPGDTRSLTYAELHREVCKFANVLKKLGIQANDRVSIYMPMVPELAIAMLACARIGAIHSVIFAGFSAEAIAERNRDAKAKLQITADAGWRRGRVLPLKQTVDEALAKSPTVEKCIVFDRVNEAVEMKPGRDFWWHELMAEASATCPATPMDSEAPLFILYTSGSTGKPKGIKHTTAGYNLFAKKTFQWVFDHRENDIFWCTADCGWVTGHTYVVYGPLSAGATVLMYEGAPNQPDESRFWQIIEKYKVTVFYTAPTAIRAFIKWGDHHVKKHDLSSLRLLGTVGEGINPEAWMWYHRLIGGERCPIVDTWWQTETGGIMMSPLPGAIATKPGSCTKPLPGIVPEIVDTHGKPVGRNQGGWLTITHPWPGMLRGIWGDDARYKEVYWSKVPGKYLAGDNARCDDDGYYWIMGRIDDVLNVSGHRLSTIEIESALVSHPKVAEAAAVGRPDELKGEAIAVFVTLRAGEPSDALREELKQHVRHEIGALAQPDDIRFTGTLPKTRSGKIMRRLLKDIAAGKETVGDTTTLEDYTVLAKIREDEEEQPRVLANLLEQPILAAILSIHFAKPPRETGGIRPQGQLESSTTSPAAGASVSRRWVWHVSYGGDSRVASLRKLAISLAVVLVALSARRSSAVTNYSWNSALTGSQSWQTNGNWSLPGFPNGATQTANLSGPLTANLTVNTIGGASVVTVAALTMGGTAGPVQTQIIGADNLTLQNDDPSFNNGNALITSAGAPGSVNSINEPVSLSNEVLEFANASTNNITLTGLGTYGTSNSLRSFMPNGLKAVIGSVGAFEPTATLFLNDSATSGSGGAPGVLEISGPIDGGSELSIGVTATTQPTPLGTVILSGYNFNFYGVVTLNRANLVLANDNALGSYFFRPRNPNQGVGFNLLSDNDARSISTPAQTSQWLTVKGEHSLTWSKFVYQTNNRGWINLLPMGKTMTFADSVYAVSSGGAGIGDTERTFTFDGTGKTEVTGGLRDKFNFNTFQPIVGDGSLGHYRKTGTGSLVVRGVLSDFHGDVVIEAGNWHFDVGDQLTNSRSVVSTGGALGIDDPAHPTFSNATLLSKINSADTGGLMLTPGEAAASLNFTVAPLANAANMSVAAPESGITYTGTITPANSTYRLGGGTGTLVLPGTNQLTSANSLVAANGGEVKLTGINNYSGTTTINGTPYVSRTNQAIADTTVGIGTDMVAGTTLTVSTLGRFGSADSMGVSSTDPAKLLINGGTLKYIGGNVKTDRSFTIGTLGATVDCSGTGGPFFENLAPLGVVNGGASFTRTLTLTGSGVGALAPKIVDAADLGKVGVTKSGNGTWFLDGDNSYSGPTQVMAGKLLIYGHNTGGGAYSVASGATLGGVGSIFGSVNSAGNVAPGPNAVGTFSVAGNVVMAAGSQFVVEVSGATSDLLQIAGNLDMSATINGLDVTSIAPFTGTNWVITTYTGTLTGKFDAITPGYVVDYGLGTSSQITLLRSMSGVPGDYNDNGIVDAADFVVWQDRKGSGAIANEGASPGIVDMDDYNFWKTHFGATHGAGGGALAAVPEPKSLLLAIWMAAVFGYAWAFARHRAVDAAAAD